MSDGALRGACASSCGGSVYRSLGEEAGAGSSSREARASFGTSYPGAGAVPASHPRTVVHPGLVVERSDRMRASVLRSFTSPRRRGSKMCGVRWQNGDHELQETSAQKVPRRETGQEQWRKGNLRRQERGHRSLRGREFAHGCVATGGDLPRPPLRPPHRSILSAHGVCGRRCGATLLNSSATSLV